MKYSNLELVQTILSSMDGDEVNSVADTSESLQVLEIVKTCYYSLAALAELPRDDDIFQLNPSINPLLPTVMFIPSVVNEIRWIKYDVQTTAQPFVQYREVKPMALLDFLDMVTNQDPSDTSIFSYQLPVHGGNFTIYGRNDTAPQFYTTTNDNTIIFDAYDSSVDMTLQGSKTMCYGQFDFPWQDSDTFVAPLDDTQFQRLLHEAKALAFAELKQSQHLKAEKTARELKIIQQSSKTKIPVETAYEKSTYAFGRRVYGMTKPTGRYK